MDSLDAVARINSAFLEVVSDALGSVVSRDQPIAIEVNGRIAGGAHARRGHPGVTTAAG